MGSWLAALSALDAHLTTKMVLRTEQRTLRSPLFLLANLGAHGGDTVVWAGITAWLWRRAGADPARRRVLWGWLVAFVAALLATLGVKRIFQRSRPGGGRFLYGPGADRHSFPSGHGARGGVILTWAETLWPGSGRYAPLLVLWIGWSRVALGIHYLGDVVMGCALGIAIGRAVQGMGKKPRTG